MLWLFKISFRGFRRFLIHGNSVFIYTMFKVLYLQRLVFRYYNINLFKSGARRPMASACLVSYNCFCANVCKCVSMFVCPSPRLLITSGLMWCDMDPIQLIKQVLRVLYSNCSHYHNGRGLGIGMHHKH